MYGHIKLYGGTGCPELAQQVSAYLGVPLSGRTAHVFSNDNIFIQLQSSVRGQDVFLIQTTSPPSNFNLMELFIFLDTLKRASAGRITAVIPYLAYARSDKKDQPRVPITARLIANFIGAAGADRYVTLDLHAGQIQGFFDIPGDTLTAFPILSDYFRSKRLNSAVVVAADLGFAKKARNFAVELELPIAFVEKRRTSETTHALTLIGEVEGQDVIIVDDEVDTAGSITQAAHLAKEHGARSIYACFAHAVFSGPAVERLRSAPFTEIVTTNSVPIPPDKRLPNITVLSVAPLLGEVIRRVHEGASVGEVFRSYHGYS